jgi:predicted metalloprotease with PDZ domain
MRHLVAHEYLHTWELPVFDRGFDGEAARRAGNVVTGVRPGSPAYAAGLRDGMTLVKREAGKPGNSRVGYVLRVDDHGTERLIRYQPEGTERFTVQEVFLTPGLTPKQRAACTRSMSGS